MFRLSSDKHKTDIYNTVRHHLWQTIPVTKMLLCLHHLNNMYRLNRITLVVAADIHHLIYNENEATYFLTKGNRRHILPLHLHLMSFFKLLSSPTMLAFQEPQLHKVFHMPGLYQQIFSNLFTFVPLNCTLRGHINVGAVFKRNWKDPVIDPSSYLMRMSSSLFLSTTAKNLDGSEAGQVTYPALWWIKKLEMTYLFTKEVLNVTQQVVSFVSNLQMHLLLI